MFESFKKPLISVEYNSKTGLLEVLNYLDLEYDKGIYHGTGDIVPMLLDDYILMMHREHAGFKYDRHFQFGTIASRGVTRCNQYYIDADNVKHYLKSSHRCWHAFKTDSDNYIVYDKDGVKHILFEAEYNDFAASCTTSPCNHNNAFTVSVPPFVPDKKSISQDIAYTAVSMKMSGNKKSIQFPKEYAHSVSLRDPWPSAEHIDEQHVYTVSMPKFCNEFTDSTYLSDITFLTDINTNCYQMNFHPYYHMHRDSCYRNFKGISTKFLLADVHNVHNINVTATNVAISELSKYELYNVSAADILLSDKVTRVYLTNIEKCHDATLNFVGEHSDNVHIGFCSSDKSSEWVLKLKNLNCSKLSISARNSALPCITIILNNCSINTLILGNSHSEDKVKTYIMDNINSSVSEIVQYDINYKFKT